MDSLSKKQFLRCGICKLDLPVDSFTEFHRQVKLTRKAGRRKCTNCVSAMNGKWYAKNKAHAISYMQEYRKLTRDAAFEAYGGYNCACCNEQEKRFLTLDHIDNRGNEHRRSIKRTSGAGFYSWLKQQNFPPGYQVLCFNCNLGKHLNGGKCPHKEHSQDA